MARPINPNPPVNVDIHRRKQRNGWIYVFERHSQYNHERKRTEAIATKLIGKLPPGCTDLKDMVPTRPRQKTERELTRDKNRPQLIAEKQGSVVTEASKSSSAASVREVLEAQPIAEDSRMSSRTIYPLSLCFLVMLMAVMRGMGSCSQIITIWKSSLKTLQRFLGELPETVPSSDTILRIYRLMGKFSSQFLEKYAQRILDAAQNQLGVSPLDAREKKIIHIDGQAVRASRVEPDSPFDKLKPEYKPRTRSALNVLQSSFNVALQQVEIADKPNEIPTCFEVLEAMDLHDTIVTADALHTQVKAASIIHNKDGYYCFALKLNQGNLANNTVKLFDTYRDQVLTEKPVLDCGHGRIETRYISVLPASLLDLEHTDKWPGLKYGCIVCSRTVREFKNSNNELTDYTRYFITNISYNTDDIVGYLREIIRSHWYVENSLHYVLDYNFNQDRLQCKNIDFFAGATVMNKIANNLLSLYQMQQISRGLRVPTKTEARGYLSEWETLIELLTCAVEKESPTVL